MISPNKKKPARKTVKQSKDIVASMAKKFREKLLKIVESGIGDLTIDIAGVEMIDSVGLGVLIATHNTLNDSEGKLTIKNVSEDIAKLFKTMRLDKHFTVKPA